MASPPEIILASDEALKVETGGADWWTLYRGYSPILATAIHNGHEVRSAVKALMAISDNDRLREEDPFTEFVIRDVPNRIVFHRSRFEVDLNRAREAGGLPLAGSGLGHGHLERNTRAG